MRFYSDYWNRRGNNYGAGVQAGSGVHTRGWNAGVKVVPYDGENGRDEFEVYMTTGSNGHGLNVRLGTVKDTPDGPVFEPAPSVLAQGEAKL